jgi:hypothetical protein
MKQRLDFLEQDIIEQAIFQGVVSVPGLAIELERTYDEIEAGLVKLASKGLIQAAGLGRYRYAGGPISEFFNYSQSKGLHDGLRAS